MYRAHCQRHRGPLGFCRQSANGGQGDAGTGRCIVTCALVFCMCDYSCPVAASRQRLLPQLAGMAVDGGGWR
jgi:hypothetical protein